MFNFTKTHLSHPLTAGTNPLFHLSHFRHPSAQQVFYFVVKSLSHVANSPKCCFEVVMESNFKQRFDYQ